MNYAEVVERVMRNHGTNRTRCALEQGYAKNYYSSLLTGDRIMAGMFRETLKYLGASVYAVNGKKRVSIDDVLGEMPTRVPLWAVIDLLRTVGFGMLVVDGEAEYLVTSGVREVEE